MPTLPTPRYGLAYTFRLGLLDMATAGAILNNPTLAAGDFKLSRDHGALVNMTNLPAVTPANSGIVVGTLTNTEMQNAIGVSVLFRDPDLQWGDGHLYLDLAPPHYGIAYQMTLVLFDSANPGEILTAPTLSTGDFVLSKDGGATANLATLPVVNPSSSGLVVVSFSATEMQASRIVLRWHDPDGQWGDGLYAFEVGALPTQNATGLALLKAGIPSVVFTRGRRFPATVAMQQNLVIEEAEDHTPQVTEWGPTLQAWEIVAPSVDADTEQRFREFMEHGSVRWSLSPFTLRLENGEETLVRYWGPFPYQSQEYAAGLHEVHFTVREESP